MSDENDNGRPNAPRPSLTLKPRAGSVSAGVVKQSFSHGRSKTVVVETKRVRTHGPAGGGNLAGPSAAEKRTTYDPRPAAPRPSGPSAADPSGNLSAEEMRARQRAIDAAREAQERQAAQTRARTEEEARRQAAEQAAARAAAEAARPAPVAAPAPAPAPVAAAPAPQAAAPAPAPVAPPPAPAPTPAPQPVAEAPRAAPAQQPGNQTRTYEPSRERRDDRPSTTTYRPDRGGTSFNQRAPREGAGNPYGQRAPRPGDRPEGDRPRGDRPQGAATGYQGARPPREGDRPQGGAPRPGGETVRYSALAPRPAPRTGDRPGGPRPPRPGQPAAPAAPEIQRATRSAPRPGGALLDRRPDDDDDRRKGAAPGKAVSRTKGEPKRREGRLTIQVLAGDDEGAAERMRSLASVRRAREREKEKRRGGGAEQARIAREVVIPDIITVQELSNRMAVRGVDIIKFLMRQGVMLKITDVIDNDTAELVATEFGHTVRRVSEADVEEGFLVADDDDGDLEPRPPVVTIMGHVDHGKTSLLDALRATDVVGGEAGGITQHIGAYQIRLEDGDRVTFLDTPGHAAFSAMRARGANITDIVVLVVAADDGVKPQTIEAIQHAKAAGVPIIVAINKIDKDGADPTRVINEMLQYELVAESLGGDVQTVEVSAKTRLGLEELLERILLQAELLDLKANPDRTAEGVVIEAKLDKGRGAVATVLVKRGTLKRGDIVVAGGQFGRVRALLNERDEQLTEAGPSTPVEILGLDGAPSPGDAFAVVENDARARELTDYRQRLKRDKAAVGGAAAGVSLTDMMAKLSAKKVSELPLVIKGDVQGSVEAIVGSLDKLATDEVRARIILSGAGAISESDVQLAKGAGAPIIGFNVRASAQARAMAEREGVEIRYYAIIYDLIDDIKGVLSGMLAPIQRETFLGNAEVLQVFDISKIGKIAGSRVTEGVVRKGAKVRIVRENVVVLELGTLATLKRFKDEVNEVNAGQECGMHFAGFQDIRAGDTIECFTVEEVKRSL
jgi:translation initiation factor IF-2